jgi:radical SAM superfamily enzyme YgiQ (UPF0313 family)
MSTDTGCDILLTYPAENINIFQYMVPLGLASLGAVLEKHGYQVKIIDFARYKGDFQRDLYRLKPSLVGIGGTTSTRKGSFLTAKLVKKIFPYIPVVYGGNHASFTAEDTLRHIPYIDYIIKGEAEYSFLKLADIVTGKHFNKTETDCSVQNVPGIAYRVNGEIVQTQPLRINNIDELPIPARHLFEDIPLLTLDFFNVDADFIMTSRGCPVCCNFCSASRMFPGGVRYRSPEKINEEIELILSLHNVKGLKLFDSTFTSDKGHVENFCRIIKPYNLIWECEIRADDNIDFGLLRLMRESGCRYIDMGLETTNETLLRKIGKKISVSKAEQILEWCRRLDIKSKVFFTFGHEYQTRDDIRNDLLYMKQHKDKIDFFATTVGMRVYPGTALESIAKRKGLMPPNFSWASYKAHLSNLILFEPGDVYIIKQKALGLFFLFKLIIHLLMQKTALSPEYIYKIILKQGSVRFLQSICMQTRYTVHVISRLLIPIRR